jgi:hypothetical protein
LFGESIAAQESEMPESEAKSNQREKRPPQRPLGHPIVMEQDFSKYRYYGLLDQVARHRDLLCADPRDKICGQLSLAGNLKEPLVPDYKISRDQVYTNFAFQVMREQLNLDFLTLLVLGQFENSSPSWAPDWQYKTTD